MNRKNQNACRGWVLKRRDNHQYVEAIISNGHPDKPVVYYTEDLQKARTFLRCKAAEERAMQLGLLVVWFVTDASGKRIEDGCIGGYGKEVTG